MQYGDGRELGEWDTAIIPGVGRSSRWELTTKKGMRRLFLHTPDGQTAMLECSHDDKFFQFKLAYFHVGRSTITDAHVIGLVTGPGGECHCFAWETRLHGYSVHSDYEDGRCAECRLPRALCSSAVGPLVEFDDNVLGMRYRTIGALGLENLGLKL